MKYLKHTLLAFTVSVLGLFNSCDYLNVDDYFVDTFNEDSIFANKTNLERYLWNVATAFPDEGAIWGNPHTPGVLATDEAFDIWDTWQFPGMKLALGEITPDNVTGSWNTWYNMYKVIRRTNNILTNINKCKDLETQDKNEILGYTYFMRAFAYYNILVDFGPVIIVGDEMYETNEKPEYYDKARATYDESMEYICTELEKAARLMPGKERLALTQFGRPHRDVALALVARLRLMHASDAFNGGTSAKRYFGTWKRSTDGEYYVSQTPDNKRWAVAAHAAWKIINSGRYKLHTVTISELEPPLPLQPGVPDLPFPDGAGDIDPYKSYKDMFSGEAIAFKNPEVIWGMFSSSASEYITHSFPVGNYGGWGGMGMPQKIVDSYYMVDGSDYKDANIVPSEKASFDQPFSGYVTKGAVSKMYLNREMRFYANVGFSGRFWPLLSTQENGKTGTNFWYAFDGNAGKSKAGDNINDYTITGYVTVKYVHNDDAKKGSNSTVLGKTFPTIRYAEMLLSYVEALNNIEGTHTITDDDGNSYTYSRDEAQMMKYFNQVRYRAGLPGMKAGMSKDEVNKLIQRERLIEFFHENRRYYDVRRWGIYEEVDSEPITGMNTEARETDFYEEVMVNHKMARSRVVDKKFVFLPIARDELRKVPMLDQNPGWN